jgi:1-acyl-sn-glycerol-3-phosphate acyltransferase
MRNFLFGLWYVPIFSLLTVLAGLLCLLVSLFSKTLARRITSQGWAAIVLTPAFIKMEARGREHLPKEGGFILYANHRSLLDIPAVAVATARPISWIAKAALGRIPVFGWSLKRVHMLVDRGGGSQAARKMISEASLRLAGGEIMAIFPEGTRNKGAEDLLPFKKGAFILAKHTGAPLFPVAIYGSGTLWPSGAIKPKPGRIKVAIGPALESGESLGDITLKAQEALQALYSELAHEESRSGFEKSSK